MNQCTKHAESIAALEESTKSAHYKIEKLEENQKTLHEMNTNIRLLFEQNKTQNTEIRGFKEDINKEMKELKTDIKTVDEKVDRLENKPLIELNSSYKKLKWLIISTIIGGIMGYFINQIL